MPPKRKYFTFGNNHIGRAMQNQYDKEQGVVNLGTKTLPEVTINGTYSTPTSTINAYRIMGSKGILRDPLDYKVDLFTGVDAVANAPDDKSAAQALRDTRLMNLTVAPFLLAGAIGGPMILEGGLAGAAEFAGSTLGGGIGSTIGSKVGETVDRDGGTRFFSPFLGTLGGLWGGYKGYQLGLRGYLIGGDYFDYLLASKGIKFKINPSVGEEGASVIDPAVEEHLTKFIEQDVYPRLRTQGHNPPTLEMPTVRLGDINEDFYDAGAFSSTGVLPSARGYYSPLYNDVTLKNSGVILDYGTNAHEIGGHYVRHNLIKRTGTAASRKDINTQIKDLGYNVNDIWETADVNVPDDFIDRTSMFTRRESRILNEAYPQINEYPDISPLDEQGAVNTGFRAEISAKNGHVVGAELNKIIEETPPGEILKMVLKEPYLEAIRPRIQELTGVKYLNTLTPELLESIAENNPEILDQINKIKQAMIKVGVVTGVTVGAALEKKYGGTLIYRKYGKEIW